MNRLDIGSMDLERLKICVVASTYPRHRSDYAVPWLRESVRRLTARGHEVTILAPSYEGLESHTVDDVEVERFRYSPKRWERLTHEQGAPNRIRNPLYQLLGAPYVLMGIRAARKLARRKHFDVVHVHWPFPHEPIGAAAAEICDAPLVVTCHGAEFALARRKKWVQPLLRRSLCKADVLIANSQDTARKILMTSGREANVIPFGSTVQPKRYELAANAVPRILFTGRLIQRKGVEYLIRAIPLILAKTDARFVITGNGDQKDCLVELARSLRVEQNVNFLGFVSNDRLNEEYALCDVWVNPSIVDDRGDTEGLGVGAIEAYAHGKPVVASAVGGIPDVVIHERTGLLVPEKDCNALAESILRMIANRDEARRFAEEGLRYAQQKFDWETITDQLEDVYWRSILGGTVNWPEAAVDEPPRDDSLKSERADASLPEPCFPEIQMVEQNTPT